MKVLFYFHVLYQVVNVLTSTSSNSKGNHYVIMYIAVYSSQKYILLVLIIMIIRKLRTKCRTRRNFVPQGIV